LFQIDQKSRKAVYSQIVDNYIKLIEGGILKPDEKIPSINEMAKMLIVNPNTVSLAYFDLAQKKYILADNEHGWSVSNRDDKTMDSKSSLKDEPDDIAILYGRINDGLRELKQRGESAENIEKLTGMAENYYIKIDSLVKCFDSVIALDEVDMSIKKGSIYGLVGSNGSGKTTILKHLAGLLIQDSGEIRISDTPLSEAVLGVTIGHISEEQFFMPGYEMKMLRKLFRSKYKSSWNDERYNNLIELFGLDETRKINTFSQGMKKQAAFTFAICSTPDILLLDETIDGLDTTARKHVFGQIIEDVADKQMTVIIASHNIRELDGICDTVGILNNGRMVTERDLDALKANVHKIHCVFSRDALTANYPYDGLDVLHMEELGNSDLLVVRGSETEISAHIKKFNPLVFELMPITLEEIFAYEKEDTSDEQSD
jgi:ABC-2 type transport system ATP-binding protein